MLGGGGGGGGGIIIPPKHIPMNDNPPPQSHQIFTSKLLFQCNLRFIQMLCLKEGWTNRFGDHKLNETGVSGTTRWKVCSTPLSRISRFALRPLSLRRKKVNSTSEK